MSAARLTRLVLALCTLASLLPSCASFPPRPHADVATSLRSCGPPEFPYQEGWLGGDAAYSVPLAADRVLWLFGDTFVGEAEQPTRVGSKFIHNSVGVATCGPDGKWRTDYAWGVGSKGRPQAFFHHHERDAELGASKAADSERFWWLFDGFVHNQRLYVGLLEVEKSEPRGPFLMPFRYVGMQLARVENFQGAPETWRFDVLPLSNNTVALPGSAMVVHDGHVYLFAFMDLDAESYPRMLARISLSELDAAAPKESLEQAESLEYLSRDGSWKPGLDADDGLVLMQDNASEMSVRFHEPSGLWLALYGYPIQAGVMPSDLISIRTAEKLEGPWSSPRTVHRIVELQPDSVAADDPNTFCYAAKEHPQLAREGRLLFSYVCNLFTRAEDDPFAVLRRLLGRMDLYRPQAVSLPFPTLLRE